mgnify:FL=1
MNRSQTLWTTIAGVALIGASLSLTACSSGGDGDSSSAELSLEDCVVTDGIDACADFAFSNLARETGGAIGIAETARQVPGLILGAIDKAVSDYGNSFDLVFIIDRTGSMSDDIAEIKNALGSILDRIETRGDGNVRVGVQLYGDFCADSNPFTFYQLTSDLDRVRRNIESITTTGGGDIPESVYEGVELAMRDMDWERSRRYAILIGDAGPHLPDSSCFSSTLADAIEAARSTGVLVNFYPILVKR